jgi:hypothetical protein
VISDLVVSSSERFCLEHAAISPAMLAATSP